MFVLLYILHNKKYSVISCKILYKVLNMLASDTADTDKK